MPKFVALLRGINVGGKNIVPMAELRALGEELGFTNVQTLLQSGNVVFESAPASNSELERRWAAAIEKRFGLKIDMVVRSGRELSAAINANPISIDPNMNLSHLFLYFLQSEAAPEAIEAVEAYDKGRERPLVVGQTLYAYYSDDVVKSKLTGAWIEKTLGVRATARNWNTVRRIAALLSD